MKLTFQFRSLRVRDIGIIAALPFVVGLPFLAVQFFLLRPSGWAFSRLASLHLSADALTAAAMALFCLLLTLALFAGHRFLRRFLRP